MSTREKKKHGNLFLQMGQNKYLKLKCAIKKSDVSKKTQNINMDPKSLQPHISR